jgi:hypothetical protein
MKTPRRVSHFGVAVVPLIDAADLRAALSEAVSKNQHSEPDEATLRATVAAIDAAARAQVSRLAETRITALDEIQRDLEAVAKHTREVVGILEPKLVFAERPTAIERVTGANIPSTPVTSAIEGGARAAGLERPDQALNQALEEIANLHLWARGAADAFVAGRKANQRAEQHVGLHDPVAAALAAIMDDPTAVRHAEERSRRRPSTHPGVGMELGLVVIASYAALTSRPVRVSRTSATMKAAGGTVSGPLLRFVQVVFQRIRLRTAREPTLEQYGEARAFNPTGSTIAAWVRAYNREAKGT